MLGRGSLFLSQSYGDIFMGILIHALQDLQKLPFTSVLASQVLMFSKACPVFLVYPVLCPLFYSARSVLFVTLCTIAPQDRKYSDNVQYFAAPAYQLSLPSCLCKVRDPYSAGYSFDNIVLSHRDW